MLLTHLSPNMCEISQRTHFTAVRTTVLWQELERDDLAAAEAPTLVDAAEGALAFQVEAHEGLHRAKKVLTVVRHAPPPPPPPGGAPDCITNLMPYS